MKTETKTKKTILMRATMMLLVMLLTAATAWAAKPSSCLDFCYGVKYGIHVQGWTYDPDASATSLDVHVYVYTDAGCTSRYGDIQVLTANVSRPDVNEAKGITGNHGFNADIAIADVGTYWVKVFAIDTGSDGNPQIGSTTQVTVTTNNVVIHSLTGAVTLEDGDVLSGTGGTDTHVTIADGATVTLSGVTIIAVSDDYQNKHPGITCAGNATIILAEGTTNNIQGGLQRAGIFVPSVKKLTIDGSGSLTVIGGRMGAGIGCNYISSCGDISIMGGTITATGGQLAAGIGSTSHQTCGTITISGGTVTATGGYRAAGIGCGESECSCLGVTITSDVVNLTATTADSRAHAIGLGANSSKSSIGFVNIGDTEMTNVPQSQIVYCPAETSTNYTVHFDKNNENTSGTMAAQVLTSNIPQALTPCGFIYDDYHDFVGWNTAANGKGYNLNDEQAVINLGDITLYAKWKATDYSITYVNAEDGIDCVTNTNPKTYNVESDEIILADPVRVGFTFDGWTYEGQDEPTKTVTIPQGSHGAKSFTAHWTFSPTATITTSTRDAFIYDGQTLTGTGGKDTHVTIADGATVTLSGVTITTIPANGTHRWAGITCEGDATIILSGDNALTGGYRSSGIFVPEGKTLVIQGDGSLNATGGDYAAGIGSGLGGSCGNIIIDGGTVMATGGGDGSAGIGSGQDGSCGDIIITRGVTSVTATKGSDLATHSIGAGKNGTCGIVLVGGVQGAIAESPYTYTPTGNMNSTIHFDANGGAGTMDDWLFTCDGTWQSLPAVTFTAPGDCIFTEWNTAADGSGISYRDEQQILDIPGLTLYAQWTSITYTLTAGTGAVMLFNGQRLTGTGGGDTRITIADGATVTLSGATITAIKNYSGQQWAGITCEGDATIILDGENDVKGGYYSSGIYVPEGKTLTMTGGGSLNATGSSYAAGIGSGKDGSCGNIIIDGGTVMATGGGNGSAGIGSGQDGFCGNIIIDGGTVTATGGPGGAGIGSGRYGSCGTITITEGITRITATKSKSSDKVDIIGKGDNKKTQPSTCGTITISPALIDETVDKTRTLWHGMVLADNADNSTAISNKDGQTTDVQLKGRTLYRDGKWNTLCLPFDVTISGSALDGDNVEAKVFDNTSSLSDAGVLTLKFSAAPATITAGTPFIVKWDNTGVNLVNPVFTGVTISGTAAQEVVSTDGKVKFVGQYSPFDITADNINEILYVASGNKIGYSKSARTLKSCRAHFWVQPNGTSAGARMINLDFGDATGIRPSSVSPEGENTEASTRGGLVGVAYYTLDGRKLSDVPTTKGVYIVNGKKVVIK